MGIDQVNSTDNDETRWESVFLGRKVGLYRRGRRCLDCGHEFATVEVDETAWISSEALSSLNRKLHRYVELKSTTTAAWEEVLSAVQLEARDVVIDKLRWLLARTEELRIASNEELKE